MRLLSPVVWSEGMYLGPHHFQAQNRYFEDSIRFATSALWFENSGLVGGEIHAEALENGTIALLHARGVFPDGLVFHMPESDPLPAPRPMADLFPPTRDKVTVFLAVPAHKPDGLNCALDEQDTGEARFLAETQTLHDETTGRDEKTVRLGRKNIRLLLDTEPFGDLVTLPVARVMRSGSGRFLPDPSFIPPCVQLSASARLMSLLGRLIEILEERSAEFSLAGGEQPSFSTQELARFWFLHTINTALAPLRHLYYSKRGHPEELFVEMSRLGGALCTFALESHPRGLPVYDHQRLGECFDALDLHIRRHLEMIIPTNCLKIPLKAEDKYFYSGEVRDQRCLGRSTWVFAVGSGGGEAEVISKTPLLVKICSRAFVPELVKRALPGFSLTHLQTPPSAISTRPGTQYFSIGKSGPCWDHIVKTRQVGVYVPGEFTEPEIELLVVIDS
ncbi:MAG: type VI secretion system baseplate subunit TssK [Acidobacteriota bacterium]|nr:type VI secretion system baseplate subunit TssK [Acidobacteriota bacterium]